MWRILRAICFVLAVWLPASPVAAGDREADHEALRAILRVGSEALNSGEFDGLGRLLHQDFVVVTVDNRKFTTIEGFRDYWSSLLKGDQRSIDRIVVRPVADELTHFLRDDVGLVQGVSNDTYHFRDRDVREMTTLWTAVVAREDGVWKLVRLHLSANVLDNPVIEALKAGLLRALVGASIGCLLLGLVIGFFVGRRRRRGIG